MVRLERAPSAPFPQPFLHAELLRQRELARELGREMKAAEWQRDYEPLRDRRRRVRRAIVLLECGQVPMLFTDGYGECRIGKNTE